MKKVRLAVLLFTSYVSAAQLIGCGTDPGITQGNSIAKAQDASAFSQSALQPPPGVKPPPPTGTPLPPPPTGSMPPCPKQPPPPSGFAVKHSLGNFDLQDLYPAPCQLPPPPTGSVVPPPPSGSAGPTPKPSGSASPLPSPSASASASPNPGPSGVPAIFSKIYGAQAIYREGDYVVITSNGRPEHKSPYYKNTAWESTLYEAYTGDPSKFIANPNQIAEYALGIKIPVNPTVASTHSATPLGPMGIAVNGVAFFNQYAAGYSALTNEVISFDQYNGHPQQEDRYHYHEEPLAITAALGKSALLGFLLDGFPVYGPEENGKTITNADLDTYHGHFGPTADYPDGIYHYHTTAEAPYINGSGFYGTPGTVLK